MKNHKYWWKTSIKSSKIVRRLARNKYTDPLAKLCAINALYKSRLKRKITRAERIFGNYLYKKNIRFIFQKGFFNPFHRIVDFYIPGKKIVFEIDGFSHVGKEEKDERRDKWYSQKWGIRFIRITNEIVYNGEFKKIINNMLRQEHRENNEKSRI